MRRSRSVAVVFFFFMVTGSSFALGGAPYPFVEQAALQPSAPDSVFYAKSLAIRGDLLFVGAYCEDRVGECSGAVYVYRRTAGEWDEVQVLVPSDASAGDQFGRDLALDGDVLMVGAPARNQSRGAVYEFTYDGASWVEGQRIECNPPYQDAYFGGTIALQDGVLVAGAVNAIAEGVRNAGAAFVFRHDGLQWAQEQRFIADQPTSFHYFGCDVDLDGDRLIVGAHGQFLGGAAHVYRFDEENERWAGPWTLLGEGIDNERFGCSVALSGDRALVGAYGTDDGAGAAWIFDLTGPDLPVPGPVPSRVTALDAGSGDLFGIEVAFEGDVAIVGATLDEMDGGNDDGAVYVFRRNGESWIQDQKLVDGLGDHLGAALAFDGERFAVGSNWGRIAYVYDDLLEVCQGRDGVDVLLVDGDDGTSTDHALSVDASGPIAFELELPTTGGAGRFVAHLNAGEPNLDSYRVLPSRLGSSCFPFLLGSGMHPPAVWNSLGKESVIGSNVYFGIPGSDPGPAPQVFLDLPFGDPSNLPVGSIWTLQAVIQNPQATSPRAVSVTNAIVITVE